MFHNKIESINWEKPGELKAVTPGEIGYVHISSSSWAGNGGGCNLVFSLIFIEYINNNEYKSWHIEVIKSFGNLNVKVHACVKTGLNYDLRPITEMI